MKSVKKSEITKKSPRQTPGSRNRQRNQKSGGNHEEIRNHRQKTSDFEISYTILPRVGPLVQSIRELGAEYLRFKD